MALVLSKTWSDGDTLSHTDLNNNFTDIKTKFNGNITTADISSSAGITNTQLATKHYEIIVDLMIDGIRWNSTSTAGDYLAFAGLPGDVDDTSYTVVQIDITNYVVTGGTSFGGTGKVDVVFGYFGATNGTFTVSDTIEAAIPLVACTADKGTAQTVVTPDDNVVITKDDKKNFFALRMNTDEAAITEAGQLICVSLKLKRTNGLRS